MDVTVISQLFLPNSVPHQRLVALLRAALRATVTLTALGVDPPAVNAEPDHVPTTTSESTTATADPSTVIEPAAEIARVAEVLVESPVTPYRAAESAANCNCDFTSRIWARSTASEAIATKAMIDSET